MNPNDRLCLCVQMIRNIFGVDGVVVFVHVYDHRFCPAHAHTRCGCNKRKGRDDDLIAGSDIKSQHYCVQCRSA